MFPKGSFSPNIPMTLTFLFWEMLEEEKEEEEEDNPNAPGNESFITSSLSFIELSILFPLMINKIISIANPIIIKRVPKMYPLFSYFLFIKLFKNIFNIFIFLYFFIFIF